MTYDYLHNELAYLKIPLSFLSLKKMLWSLLTIRRANSLHLAVSKMFSPALYRHGRVLRRIQLNLQLEGSIKQGTMT